MSQYPVQPNLKSVQLCRIRLFPKEIVPIADCSHGEKISFSVQSESPQDAGSLEDALYTVSCKYVSLINIFLFAETG